VLNDMRERLQSWMMATDDPLLKGPIRPPATARISLPTDETPFQLWQRLDRPEGYS